MVPLLVDIGVVLTLILLSLALNIVRQYERGVLFRLGRVVGTRDAGLTWIIPGAPGLAVDQLNFREVEPRELTCTPPSPIPALPGYCVLRLRAQAPPAWAQQPGG